jgi:arylsulfatase A-like enzyme
MALRDQTGAPTRREFLQASLGVAGTALAAPLSGFAESPAKPERPNLVFIYTEGQRADAVSIAGNPILQTPNQDRTGREGVRFTQAFCTNALCAPARATALTGLYSKTTGALDNKVAHGSLPSDIPLFTDILHQAGYEVAIAGKVHVLNGVKERYWDYYFGFNAPATNYYNPRLCEGRKGVIGEEKVYKNSYADDLITDRALAWLEQKREKPFCLLLWLQTPHAPFYRARRHLDLYSNITIPKPATFDDDMKGYPGKPKAFVDADNKIGTTVSGDAARSLDELVKDYYAGLVDVDENIGRIYQYLENSGQLDNTAILQTSDHGYFLGEWRMFDKRFMHEPSIRVPMMLRYPKRIKPGTVRDEMILDIDIAPTLLDLAGIEKPKHMQGKSVVGLAAADDPNWRKEWFYDYYEYPGNEQVRPHRGIRTERYKLIYYYLDPQEYELYDLVQDPGETRNLYGDPEHAPLQNDLWKRLQTLQAQIPQRQASPAT